MLAFDIEGFTRPDRDEAIRIYLHKALYEIISEALEGAGLPWGQCHHEDRGDGALVILPPSMPAQPVIDPFPERLRGLLRRYNGIARDAAQMRLRVAAHIGPVYSDAYGAVGDDLNLLFRMLEAAPLRKALAGSKAELALIISDYMYDSLVIRHRTFVDPALFSPLKTQVKRTRVSAWIYLPGADPFLPAAGIAPPPADGRAHPALARAGGRDRPPPHSPDSGPIAQAGRPAEPLAVLVQKPAPALELNARHRIAESMTGRRGTGRQGARRTTRTGTGRQHRRPGSCLEHNPATTPESRTDRNTRANVGGRETREFAGTSRGMGDTTPKRIRA